MPRPQINIFSISLLDILSGALGAVIILYIIIDKKPNDYTQGFEDDLIQCDSALTGNFDELRAGITDLKNDIPSAEYRDLLDQLDAAENNVTCFKSLIDEQQEVIKELGEQLDAARDSIQELEQSVRSLEQELAAVQQELTETKQQLEQCEAEKAELQQQLQNERDEKERYQALYEECDAERNKKAVGFELTDKTVFVLDVSGSMEGEKLANVKAGLKMLITTMNQDYATDVVFFPNERAGSDYGYRYGSLRTVTQTVKYEIYNFLETLVAEGGTPTESVMNYALRAYPDATTVVLLSDGEPDDVDSNGEARSMVSRISGKNGRGITINTIGVGDEFRTPAPSVKKYFLEQLAKTNDGFFEGF